MQKVKLFSFQKMNKYFLMPFIIPITCFSTKFFSETMKTDSDRINIKEVTEDNTHTFVFLYQIIQSISLIIGGLFYFIELRHLKKTKPKINIQNEIIEHKNNNNLINDTKAQRNNSDDDIDDCKEGKPEENKKFPNFKIFFVNHKDVILIVIMPVLVISYNLSIGYAVGYPQLEKRIYFLFFFTLINILLFKKQIYRHQKLALLITVIGAIFIYIAFAISLNIDIYNILYDIFLFLGSFLFSLYLVSYKYLTFNKSISPFKLLLYLGVLSFVYTIIIFIIISIKMKGDLTYISNIFHCDENNYICVSYYFDKIIMYIILNTFTYTLVYFVVYIFSPELFAIADIFSPLFSYIYKFIDKNEKNGVVITLTVVGYLVIAFGAFIYTEIIVCHFWRLSENTWKAIDKKATDESYGLYKNYSLMEKDYGEEDNEDELVNTYDNNIVLNIEMESILPDTNNEE